MRLNFVQPSFRPNLEPDNAELQERRKVQLAGAREASAGHVVDMQLHPEVIEHIARVTKVTMGVVNTGRIRSVL
ncbi:hypothetical protein WK59_13050 [Burkholderia ubonensis]|nr:hypothetical protein WI84_26275 [Burkholderia ubonensis]KVT55518.1 hypothetical protein WK54_16950 [Burkholderia ubonensis]KVT84388.1 hypothetical protein WK59_13050 [Burkholderia ubonensis]